MRRFDAERWLCLTCGHIGWYYIPERDSPVKIVKEVTFGTPLPALRFLPFTADS